MPLPWVIFTFLAATFFCAWSGVRRACGSAERWTTRTTARSMSIVFLVSLALGAMPTILGAVPPPSTHDEFAYLLAADTFTHGRLTNPTPPLWEHFETFHQIMRPTYMAKFPPGQGIALAAGKLFGLPILGAFGTIALGCAAICWMLRGWMPPRWAFLGGIVAAAHPTIFWWGQIYWGAGVAMLGGALFAGSAIRASRQPTVASGIVAGIGLAILANSRPFEGALFSAILLAVLAWFRRLPALRSVIYAGLVLAPVFAWMLYYDFRVTGNAFTMPYAAHAKQYMMSPLFWWQNVPAKPTYTHSKLQQYYELYEFKEFNDQRESFRGFLAGLWNKVRTIARDYFAPPTLAIPLLALPQALRRSRLARIVTIVCILFPTIHMLLTPWMRMQYLAPAAGVFVAILAMSMRQMSRWKPLGPAIVRAVIVVQVIAVIWLIGQMKSNTNPTGAERARIVRQLEHSPGQHLVMVRYGPGRQSIFEWVYNDADIERAKVVFARAINPDEDRRLIEHFPGRRVWLLSVDGTNDWLDEIR